jgi:hypothetical protein
MKTRIILLGIAAMLGLAVMALADKSGKEEELPFVRPFVGFHGALLWIMPGVGADMGLSVADDRFRLGYDASIHMFPAAGGIASAGPFLRCDAWRGEHGNRAYAKVAWDRVCTDAYANRAEIGIGYEYRDTVATRTGASSKTLFLEAGLWYQYDIKTDEGDDEDRWILFLRLGQVFMF